MEVKKIHEGEKLTVEISGRLDAVTAMELSQTLPKDLEGVKFLTFDFANLQYIASAGLRLLLKLQKQIGDKGNLTVKNLQQPVREVLDMSGFSNVLNIEDEKKLTFGFSIAGDNNDSEVFKL